MTGRFRPVLLLALLAVLPTACAHSEAAPSAAKDKPASPPKTLSELQDRLVRYADSLKTPKDGGGERLAWALGVKLAPDPEAPESLLKLVVHRLPSQHAFVITSLPNRDGFDSNELRVAAPNGKVPDNGDTALCIWDVDTFSKRLQAIGFEAAQEKMPFGRGWDLGHARPIGDGKQMFTIRLLIYSPQLGDASKDCVYGVRFGGGNK